ncbi:hypothetical protein ACVIW2_005890 [Bradyrhizobium huanghuaihaiense]|uniref:Uncharacterized protein n=1 Tax=Bradyrhizobium huanghuaihaiense TaxID=990078 RepID=A0A562RMX5_9BRAD|nr:hypothetical protein IQ16_03583 [Bradyrhizobium huanghuaihaiense]
MRCDVVLDLVFDLNQPGLTGLRHSRFYVHSDNNQGMAHA